MKRIIIILLAVLLSGCYGAVSSTSSRSSAPSDITIPVTYRISGYAGEVSLTYQNAQGGTEQIASAPVPWSKTFNFHYGDFVYVSAQNQGTGGSVICEILLDGKPWKQSTSSGAYCIATCSGALIGKK